jgi:hypothetical protein
MAASWEILMSRLRGVYAQILLSRIEHADGWALPSTIFMASGSEAAGARKRESVDKMRT